MPPRRDRRSDRPRPLRRREAERDRRQGARWGGGEGPGLLQPVPGNPGGNLMRGSIMKGFAKGFAKGFSKRLAVAAVALAGVAAFAGSAADELATTQVGPLTIKAPAAWKRS